MVQLVLFIFIIAMIIFLWLKSKQENRNAEKHNRLLQKQDELVQMLQQKAETQIKTDNNEN